MRLDFMDRTEETRRLKRAFASRDGAFCCLHGRRRCGKSRLLQETLPVGGIEDASRETCATLDCGRCPLAPYPLAMSKESKLSLKMDRAW